MTAFPPLMTALITPFTDEGTVDTNALAKVARFVVDQGSQGLVATGTTGESATLSNDEVELVWRTVVEAVGDRAVVIAGVGTNATAESVRRARLADQVGVDGVMAVAPYYVKPSQRGMMHHFTQIAESADLPVLLYNIPARAGVEILPETLLELAQIPNVAGVKDVVGDITKTTWLLNRAPEDFGVWTGDDGAILPWLSIGATGVVSVVGHILSPQIREMIEVYPTDPARARAIHHEIADLCALLFTEPNPAPLKAAMSALGYCGEVLRSPMVPVTDETRSRIVEAMQGLSIL